MVPPDRPNRIRRSILAYALGLTAGAIAEEPSRKLSKREAQYQDTPRGGLRCAGCTLFVRPDACKVVEGTVSPSGWCKLFDMSD